MKSHYSLLVGLILLSLGACPSESADDPGTILLAGDISGVWELFGDPSPSPACRTGPWTGSLGEGESYLFTGGGDTEPCLSAWVVYCNEDSLGYQGSWTTDDPTNYVWNFSFVDCAITARLSFANDMRLHVHSASAGVLQSASHRVVITPENGDEVLLLGPDPSADIDLDLPAGIYTVAMVVDIVEHSTHYDYRGDLKVWWERQPVVADTRRSWSGVKTQYR